MARRLTYGERMAEFERRQDESNWNQALNRALAFKDYDRIYELVREGMDENYDFPHITDAKVLSYVEGLRK